MRINPPRTSEVTSIFLQAFAANSCPVPVRHRNDFEYRDYFAELAW